MDVATAVGAVTTAQGALKILTALALTAYMWPAQPTVSDGSTYDFIIVGAGSAGSVVANRLTENEDVTVLLIEAGGYPPMESVISGLLPMLPHSDYDWNYTSINDGYTAQRMKNQVAGLTAGKMLGGSSSLHHVLHVRGAPDDFDSWAKTIGDDSWSYNNVLPYFIKSERLEDDEILNSETGSLHGTDGYLGLTREPNSENLKILQAFSEIGHKIVLDTNSNETLGYTEPMLNIADNVRQCGAQSYLRPIKDRSNLHVLTTTEVTKIIFDGTKAIGVEAISDDAESYTFYANKEIILSAGAFNTPKILMLSGVGPTDHLETLDIEVLSDLPVGQNLQDHPPVVLVHKMEESTATVPASDPHRFPAPVTIGYVALDADQTFPDYQTINLIIPHDEAALLQFCSVAFSYQDEICQRFYDNSAGRTTLFTVHNLLHPLSRGYVQLKSKNYTDTPLIYTGIYTNQKDLDNMGKYLEDFAKITNSTYFKSVNAEIVDLQLEECQDYEFGSLDYWRCYALSMSSTMWQYSGTCSMGPVVDGKLKVLGIDGVRVVDASAMPLITSGNINAAVVMIAEKASDIIKEDWNLA